MNLQPMIEAQLPIWKITAAKLFALMTLLLILFYKAVTSSLFYMVIGGISFRFLKSDSYFAVVHFEIIYYSILAGLLLTATYFFLPQLQQKIAFIVFLLLITGLCMIFFDRRGKY